MHHVRPVWAQMAHRSRARELECERGEALRGVPGNAGTVWVQCGWLLCRRGDVPSRELTGSNVRWVWSWPRSLSCYVVHVQLFGVSGQAVVASA